MPNPFKMAVMNQIQKAVILVVDGFGIGSAPDADSFGDTGANTFGHIAEQYLKNQGQPLPLPNLAAMGLSAACQEASGTDVELPVAGEISGAFGAAAELSTGKDTPSGHWEMTGAPVFFDWGYYPEQPDCFPETFLAALQQATGVPGFLGCCHASGTDIIRELGELHCQTGKPICYTSADSVFQVAAHEDHFGLDELYAFCEAARELLFADNIGRVIARPFTGDAADSFARTGNRRDYSIEPHTDTLLDVMIANGKQVAGIGKISDIFAHRGISSSTKATGLPALIDETINHLGNRRAGTLIFTNLVNFDQDFGHRRDPAGYADALMYLDERLPEIQAAMGDNDLLIITSDHGCDPTWQGTDHTREFVPVLAWRRGMSSVPLGKRQSFADIGQTLASCFELPPLGHGTSFAAALS